MDTETKKSLIYGAAVVVAVSIWCASDYSIAHVNRYEMHSEGSLGLTFLLDKQSGAIWRYYRNHDTNNVLTDEGFMLVHRPLTSNEFETPPKKMDATW